MKGRCWSRHYKCAMDHPHARCIASTVLPSISIMTHLSMG